MQPVNFRHCSDNSGVVRIPKLEALFDCEREGFTLETVDGNLSVTQLTSDGLTRMPQADRNWQLTYRRKPDLRGDTMFPFPKLKEGVKPATIEYKHYQDADIATIDASEAARGIRLVSTDGNSTRNGVIAALLALLLGGIVWLMRRGKKSAVAVSEELAAPADPTPFSTVAFLRRILSHHGERLSEIDRSALSSQIKEIESGFFSGGQAPSIDLTAIVNRWLGVVRKIS